MNEPHYYKKRTHQYSNDFCFEKSKTLKSNEKTLYFKNIQGDTVKITVESYINRLAFLYTQSKYGNNIDLFEKLCNQIRNQAAKQPETIFTSPEKLLKRLKKSSQ